MENILATKFLQPFAKRRKSPSNPGFSVLRSIKEKELSFFMGNNHHPYKPNIFGKLSSQKANENIFYYSIHYIPSRKQKELNKVKKIEYPHTLLPKIKDELLC